MAAAAAGDDPRVQRIFGLALLRAERWEEARLALGPLTVGPTPDQLASWGLARAVDYLSAGAAPPWVSIFINYSAMLTITLILVIASSLGDPSGFGFMVPRKGAYGTCVTWGLVLGAAATIVTLLAHAGGVSILRGLGFLQMVLLIWIFAPVAEEMLFRGYVQGYLEPLRGYGFHAFHLRFSLPIAPSSRR